MDTLRERYNVVKLNDWHIPFHDPIAIEAAFSFCERIHPNVIIMDEIHDFYQLSRFNKDPNRKESLQDELDVASSYLLELRKRCPDSRFILLASNHLDRLRKFLWREAAGLASLRALELKSLLNLDAHNVEFMDVYRERDYLWKHGDIVRKHSGYTARAEFEREGMSGASGHTHRIGAHYITRRGGEYMWMECGCLCSLDAEYIDGIANWQQGIGLTSFESDGKHYFATPLPIIDGRIWL